MKTKELRDPTISKACARIMARFHRLQMPMVKRPRWLFDTIGRYLENSSEVGASGELQTLDSRNGFRVKMLLDTDFEAEYENLMLVCLSFQNYEW